MNARELDEKIKNERAKKAVALAMKNRWEEAVAVNQTIVRDFPEDIGSYNRLGKALSELGRNKEAQEAFRSVLKFSPNNSIAKKNLSRLMKLSDADAPRVAKTASRRSQTFIEESGNAGVTSLIKLASSDTLAKLTPGDMMHLEPAGSGLVVKDETGAYVGQVEPRVGTRIARLAKGGNLYEAAVTSVEERGLAIIIRETYKTPAQSGIVSFPSRGGADYRVYVPSAVMGYEVADGDDEERELAAVAVKDWSDDDTEPGDDEAFSPVIHRIINPPTADIAGVDDDF
jgi:hypothetical protein